MGFIDRALHKTALVEELRKKGFTLKKNGGLTTAVKAHEQYFLGAIGNKVIYLSGGEIVEITSYKNTIEKLSNY